MLRQVHAVAVPDACGQLVVDTDAPAAEIIRDGGWLYDPAGIVHRLCNPRPDSLAGGTSASFIKRGQLAVGIGLFCLLMQPENVSGDFVLCRAVFLYCRGIVRMAPERLHREHWK